MRWKLLLFYLTVLGAAHFAASPLVTRGFNEASARFAHSAVKADKISLDFITAQASAQNLRLLLGDPQNLPAVTVRNLIVHWGFWPMLSKHCVIEEISVAGADCTIPFQEAALLALVSAAKAKLPSSAQAPEQKNVLPFTIAKKGDSMIVRYPPRVPLFTLRDLYLADIKLALLSMDPERPPLPAMTNLNLKIHNAMACLQEPGRPTEFTLETKLVGQDASYVKIEGSICRNAQNATNGHCEARMEGLDIARLWPWINPAWMPEDFRQFRVAEGLMTISSRITITDNVWYFQNDVALKSLRVEVNPESEYKKIRGATPELVVKAINTLGDARMQFSNYQDWKKQFEENVMHGLRNLIRQSIHNALMRPSSISRAE